MHIKSNWKKTTSKYLIGYLDKDIAPLVLILPKMRGYVKTFKDKDVNKDNKLMSFSIDDEKLFKKSIKPFGLKLRTWKILNWMLYLLMMIDI